MGSVATEPTPASELDHRLRDLAPGWRFAGRYRMEGLVGRGAMGVVWRAQDETLERPVALKFLVETLVHDPMAIDDLKRETRRALELTHHNIVRVYDFVEDQAQGLAGIAMEFFPGQTVAATRVSQAKRCFEPETIAPWIAQLCDAMAYAHEKVGVIHRDLKPQNLMIDDRGELKITDFGIARVASDSLTRISIGKVSGTPCYMSPQQARGEAPTATDDIYAIGATLYELLTSRPPFWQGNIGIQLLSVTPPPMRERRRELTGIDREIPARWEETVAACLAKESPDRPRNTRELADRLGIALPSTSFRVLPSTAAPRVAPPVPTDPAPTAEPALEPDAPTLVGVPMIPPPLPRAEPRVEARPPATSPPLAPAAPVYAVPVPVAPPPAPISPPFVEPPPVKRSSFPSWLWVTAAGVALAILAFAGGAVVRHVMSDSGPAENPAINLIPGTRAARTVHVPDEFSTIQAAIDDSRPGDAIVIRPGTYRESLTMRDGLRLSGESADACRLVPPQGAAAVLVARTVRGCVIENLTIDGSGVTDASVWSAGWTMKNDRMGVIVESVVPNSPAAKAGIGPGVRLRSLDGQTVEQAEEVPYLLARIPTAREVEVEWEANGTRQARKITTERLAGGGNWPDGIVASNAEIKISGCTVRSMGGEGIVLLGPHTSAEVAGNHVTDGAVNGISLIRTGASVMLRGNDLQRNKGPGLRFDAADGTAIENVIAKNGSVGILVASSESSPTLQRNECRNHPNSGIYFTDGANGMADSNTCEGNGDSGILVTGASTAPTLRANHCVGNTKNGIFFTQGARGLAEKNIVEKSGFPGIAVQGRGTAPTLRGNECRTNTQSGILFMEGAEGLAETNTCEGNGDAGIAVLGRDSAPRLVANQCNRNRDNGMSFGDQSSPRVENNTCSNNTSNGIGVVGRSSPAFVGNTCRSNGVHGISFATASRGSATGNICEGNGDSGFAAFGEGTAPDFVKNTSRGNVRYGIFFGNGADGSASGNLCEENHFSGIGVAHLSTRPSISGNRLVKNQKFGIEVFTGASPRLAPDNEFSGNGAGNLSK